MKLSDLKYEYPEELIATSPSRPTRVMWAAMGSPPEELNLQQLLAKIPTGDVLVINNTKVLRRRVFTDNGIEVLFLNQLEDKKQSNIWSVLFPSKKHRIGDEIALPSGFKMRLLEKGRPQIVEVFPAISDEQFAQIAELPLPPYIQKARNERHNSEADERWYQTAWAEVAGSMAAPTASLHFSREDLLQLQERGVAVVELTLHVGLGTFLPVTAEDLDQHQMHSEYYSITEESWGRVCSVKNQGGKVWALGTTTTRVLESVSRTQKLAGDTDILLQVGSQFNIVDRLLTNFHQPESTLLALVAGFYGLSETHEAYRWAIANRFRLFSYGDLSAWVK